MLLADDAVKAAFMPAETPELAVFLQAAPKPVFNCNFRDYHRRRNIALLLQYDGRDFAGFQRQKNALSVQEVLERCLSRLCGEDILIYGCSRTDAKVSALAYVANFYTDAAIPLAAFPLACQALLPPSVSVLEAVEVEHDFNARFSTLAKTYYYDLLLARFVPALLRPSLCRCYYQLDVNKMKEAAALLVGEHDFRAFCAAKAQVTDYRRRVLSLQLREFTLAAPFNLPCLRFVISGDGFLYNMVRIIVGTLTDVGRGRLSVAEVAALLAAGERTRAGMTMPPEGLTLAQVYYPERLFASLSDSPAAGSRRG